MGWLSSSNTQPPALRPWRWGCSALLLFSLGCAREPIPDYALSEATMKLPESHQQQIEATLIRFFGTPTSPHWMKAGPEVAAEDAAGAAAEAAEGEAAAATESAPEARKDPTVYGGVKLEPTADVRHLRHGAEVYRSLCAGCHGVTGDGNGVAGAYLVPRPRDYRRGVYKFTSTPYGYKPARADLVRTNRRGAKGTSMPAFPWMSEEDLEAVIDYVILLSQRGEVEVNATLVAESDYEAEEEIDPADFLDALTSVQESWAEAEGAVVLPVSAQPAYTDETIAAGRQAFMTLGCSKCHGEDGKGQTEWLNPEFLAEQEALPEDQRIKINYDAWGRPAPAADLTARMLHGGRRPIDIYRRIYTGINGTPMPAFAEVDPDTLWHLVHYVLSIVEGRGVQSAEPPAEATASSS